MKIKKPSGEVQTILLSILQYLFSFFLFKLNLFYAYAYFVCINFLVAVA